ncbi:hypothetical protein D5H78_15270 [Vallicoccus soli]|uniref:PEGA domain-containing protein n=1 Tax=Vallicoccus soli TaxID=2339232 RepID=A0A3A3YQQ5_9ACTN|nr:hypothetical protein D5H78_15270 [Vallicoccus soli]
MESAAEIRLFRVYEANSVMRAYRVYVDGARAGSIRAGEERSFPVATGDHEVQVRIDWTRSAPFLVSVAPGEVVRLRCAAKADYVNSLRRIITAPHDFLEVTFNGQDDA